jgi:methylenetetrahydrofolate reductase (NADPH)
MSLRDRLTAGSFAVTAEISPPRGASTDPIAATAALLRDWVDAVNITDNQGSNVRLASWAGSLAALQAGLEPIMQMTCRDRNRIALQSDLLGASALGIRNVLVMTGDHPKFGDHPEAKPVFDLDSVQLLWTLRHMRDQGAVLSGRALKPPPDCFLGAVENPAAPPAEFRAERLGKKVAAGAQFVQTQFVFDVAAFAQWMVQVRDLGLHEQCYILPGVGADGGCEVYPERRCVWVEAFERADSQGRVADLRLLHLPIDHRRWGESSWLNYWQGRDEDLWAREAGDTGDTGDDRHVPHHQHALGGS